MPVPLKARPVDTAVPFTVIVIGRFTVVPLAYRKVSEAWPAAAAVTLYPQILVNVRTQRSFDFGADRDVERAVAKATAALGSDGRVLLRASGTEPVIRVMVEGKSRAKVGRWAETIADAVRKAAR